MIAELFYPRELKNLITELDAIGRLSRVPLQTLNGNFYAFSIVSFIVPIIILANFYKPLEIDSISEWAIAYTIGVLLGFILTVYNIYSVWHHDILPYSKGEIVVGKIIKKQNRKKPDRCSITYSFHNQGNDLKRRVLFDNDNNDEWESAKTGSIRIFVWPFNRKCHAPLILKRFKRLCLDNKRIKEVLESKSSETQL